MHTTIKVYYHVQICIQKFKQFLHDTCTWDVRTNRFSHVFVQQWSSGGLGMLRCPSPASTNALHISFCSLRHCTIEHCWQVSVVAEFLTVPLLKDTQVRIQLNVCIQWVVNNVVQILWGDGSTTFWERKLVLPSVSANNNSVELIRVCVSTSAPQRVKTVASVLAWLFSLGALFLPSWPCTEDTPLM